MNYVLLQNRTALSVMFPPHIWGKYDLQNSVLNIFGVLRCAGVFNGINLLHWQLVFLFFIKNTLKPFVNIYVSVTHTKEIVNILKLWILYVTGWCKIQFIKPTSHALGFENNKYTIYHMFRQFLSAIVRESLYHLKLGLSNWSLMWGTVTHQQSLTSTVRH
jgi:hypothetical protein